MIKRIRRFSGVLAAAVVLSGLALAAPAVADGSDASIEKPGPSASIGKANCPEGGYDVTLDNSRADEVTTFAVVSIFGDLGATQSVKVPASETETVVARAPEGMRTTMRVSAKGVVLAKKTVTLVCEKPGRPSASIGKANCPEGGFDVTLDNRKVEGETEFDVGSAFGDRAVVESFTVPAGETKTVVAWAPAGERGTIAVRVGKKVLAKESVTLVCEKPGRPSASIGKANCPKGGYDVTLDNSRVDEPTEFLVEGFFGDVGEVTTVTVVPGGTSTVVAWAQTGERGTITVRADGTVLARKSVLLTCKGDEDVIESPSPEPKPTEVATPVPEVEQKGSQLPFTGLPLGLLGLVAAGLIGIGGLIRLITR